MRHSLWHSSRVTFLNVGRIDRFTRRRHARRGVVLVTAMWVLVVLLVVGLSLAYDTQISIQSVRNTDQQTRAYYAALSGLERAAAELDAPPDNYTAPGQTWEQFDSTSENLLPEADQYGYQVLVEDNCARADLNITDEKGLGQIPDLTADEAQAIQDYRSSGSQAQTTPAQGTTAAVTASKTFRSVDDLLLVQGITPEMVYGIGVWEQRLSAAERFHQEWAQLQGGTQAQTQTANSTTTPLIQRFCVGARARRLGSDAEARVTLDATTRDDLRERLKAVAPNLGLDNNAASQDSGNTTGRGNRPRSQSPVDAALGVLNSRNVRGWSQVWGAVGNNRDAVRLLADVVTLPNDTTAAAAGNDTGGGGFGGGGFGGGGFGGGGGRGGGPGGGGPGGGGPGGPGGGRGGPGGGGPGGGGPGGGGPGGGGPGGGGPGGGRPGGGGGRGAAIPGLFLTPTNGRALSATLATYHPGTDGFTVRLAQAGGGGGGGGRPGGGAGGGGTGGGGRPGGGGGQGGGGQGGRPGGGGGGTQTGGGQPGGANSGTGSGTSSAATLNLQPMEGAINLNTAPLEVLLSLPQMTEQVAQAIVDYRSTKPFVSRGDLLQIDTVTPAIFNAVIEKVTVISDTYTVRVLGLGETLSPGSGRPSDIGVHLTAILDRSNGRCRIARLRQDN